MLREARSNISISKPALEWLGKSIINRVRSEIVFAYEMVQINRVKLLSSSLSLSYPASFIRSPPPQERSRVGIKNRGKLVMSKLFLSPIPPTVAHYPVACTLDVFK